MLEWLLLCSLAVIWLSFKKKKKNVAGEKKYQKTASVWIGDSIIRTLLNTSKH